MWLKNFFKSLSGTTARRPVARRPQTARLGLEAIEDRCLPSYLVTDLGTLGGDYSYVRDINDSGQAVGYSLTAGGNVHGFVWQNGVMTDLGTLGTNSSEAFGINDFGQIVGRSVTQDGTYAYHGFLLTPEDTDGNGAPDRWFRDSNSDGKNDLMLDLGPYSVANDVNNAGQVVGSSWDGGRNEYAVLWENGVRTDLGALGGYSSSATAINDAGQVAGTGYVAGGQRSAFLWQDGVMYDLGAATASNDINRSGQIAGAGPWSSNDATLWTPTAPNGTTGSFRSLGTLPPLGPYFVNEVYMGSYSVATGVNDSGTAVGHSHDLYSYSDPEGGYSYEVSRAFVWADGVMEELPLNDAAAVNNAGQIVGNYNGAPWEYRPNRAYLLTPGNGTAPPSVTIDDVTVTEGNGGTRTAVFTVRLSEASSQTVTVEYSTADVSTTAGSDYQRVSGTLAFAPGETSKTVTVLVTGDRRGEPNETFVVNLTRATSATVADGTGVGTILDDEPRISIGDVTKTEGGRNKKTQFTFTVTLSAAYDQPVTVSFRTADGTATTGDGDYVAKTGAITFAPGETTKTITIEVKGDSKREAAEYFYLDLYGNSTNSLFTKYRGLGTILNDD
jgi:probable HAF family extracellular repeat protein